MSLVMIHSRYRRITLFFARIFLSFLFWDAFLPRIWLGGLSNRNRKQRLRRYAISFRALAVSMGGVLIKVGQFLSSRVDILPPEFTNELEGLQDEVPPESFESIRRTAEAELGAPLIEKFAAFEETPLAAASLGQAHRARMQQPAWPLDDATLRDMQGYDVVVKIQRTDIEAIIETDLAALNTVGKWLQRYHPISKRANVPALLAEFTRILYQEIDYLNEGKNVETFTANFKGWEGVRVPRVVWSHTTHRTLTLENVLAIKINDYQAIEDAGISRAAVASRLLDTYLKQIFEDGFFHADPHPGNLFVHPLPVTAGDSDSQQHPWELTFIDFGMTGVIPPTLLTGLREVLIGVGMRDSARLIRGYQIMDVLLPSADILQIERASSRVFERYWGKSMSELTSITLSEVQDLADEFRDLMYAMPFQVPQNVIFLGRSVGILSGMCTGLDPQFNLWKHLAPYAEKMIAEESAGRNLLLQELGDLGRAVISVPRKLDTMLTKMERGDMSVRTPEFPRQAQRLEKALYQVAGSITFTGLLLGGIQLHLGGQTNFALGLLIAASINFIWLLLHWQREM